MLVPVRKGHELDEAKLSKYLAQAIPSFKAPLKNLSQFQGGQSNPTYYLKDSNDKEYVLRKKPPGKLLNSAHQVEREYRIIKALENTDIPVPHCYCLCEDSSVIGTPFYVTQFLQGRVFRDVNLLDLTKEERADIYNQMIEVLAKIHSIDWRKLGLQDFGREGNYYERQISRWSRQYAASETEKIEPMDNLINWLPKNIPPTDEVTIVHGDYRLENLMFHQTEPRVIAVLDWELSTLGNPLADVSYNCLPYYVGFDIVGEGIPPIEKYLEKYCRLTNRKSITNWHFYLAFSIFRSAAIFQGVIKRAMQGNAANANASSLAPLPRMFSERGWELAQSPCSASESEHRNIFSISPKAQEVIEKLKKFVNEIVIPEEKTFHSQIREGADRWKYFPEIMEELKTKAKAQGLWNLFIPSDLEHSPGFTNVEYSSMAEVMGRSHIASEAFNCSAPDTGNMEILIRFGTPQQKAKWLPDLLEGKIRSCFAMTEPDVASSDARNIQSSIRREGDKYVINGRKWYISGAGDPRCKIMFFMGKTDTSATAYKQQSIILIPMDTPGITIVRACGVIGYDDAPHGHMEITFNEVVVPAGNILLGEGRGFEIAQARLGPGRIHHCMRAIGLAERALEEMCKRALQRVAFDKPLAAQGTIQADIAYSRIEIEQCRLLALKAAHMIDTEGAKKARDLIAMLKIAAPAMACRVVDRAIQVHGARGVSQDSFLSYAYALVRTLRIVDGPDEVHRIGLARTELRQYAKL